MVIRAISLVLLTYIYIHADNTNNKFEIMRSKSVNNITTQLPKVSSQISNKDLYIFDDSERTTHKNSVKKPIHAESSKKISKNIVVKKESQKKKDITKHSTLDRAGLTLKQAILKAIARNDKLVALKQKVIQAKRQLDQKESALLPLVYISANSGKIYQDEEQDEEDNKISRFSQGDFKFAISQNLYEGGKTTYEIKVAKEALKAALAKYQSYLEKEILTIVDSYLSLVYEKKIISENRSNIEDLVKILEIVTIKEQNGAATKGDLNYIKSNIENIKSSLVLAEAKYKNSISFYEYFIGSIKDNNYPVEDSFNISINPNVSIEKLILRHPQLTELESQITRYRYDLESKKSKFKPTVDLILSDKLNESTEEGVNNKDKKSAVLSLYYPLYNGGRDKAVLFETKSKIDEFKFKYLDKKKTLIYNAIQLYNNLSSSKKSLEHIKNELDANKRVIDSYWSAFKFGTQDLQALLLAQKAYNSSKLKLIENNKSYVSEYFKLLSSTGSLLKYMKLENIVQQDSINQTGTISIFRNDMDKN
jgi:outer membrane protein TolC